MMGRFSVLFSLFYSLAISSLSSLHLPCRKEYHSVPKLPSVKLNRSSPISTLFNALHGGAVFNGTCYSWKCYSQKYYGQSCQWCLPSVMIAGFSKCGTTAFCNKLSHHPSIRRYRKKEVNILTKFNDFSWETLEIRSQDPHSHSRGRLWMDCSSGAFRDLQVATHLRKYSPHTKVIFLVRDPWQRIGSYIEMIRRNSRSVEEYEDLLDRLKDKIRRHGVQPDSIRLSGHGIKHLAEVNNFMYVENILMWRSVLDKEQVLVLDHYDLEHHPLKTMRKVEDFLEIHHHNYSKKVLSSISSNTVSVEENADETDIKNAGISPTSLIPVSTVQSKNAPTESIHPPYSLQDKKLIYLTKRLFIPSLCLFEEVFGWPIQIVTPEILKSLTRKNQNKQPRSTDEVEDDN